MLESCSELLTRRILGKRMLASMTSRRIELGIILFKVRMLPVVVVDKTRAVEYLAEPMPTPNENLS